MICGGEDVARINVVSEQLGASPYQNNNIFQRIKKG